MANLYKETESTPNGLAYDGSEKTQNLGITLEKVSHNLGQDIGKAAGVVSIKTSDYLHSTRNYIEEKPFQSIALAAAAGIAIGSLLTLIVRRK